MQLRPLVTAKTDTAKQENGALTVGELTRQIKGVLEQAFMDVVVEGEISNYTNHRSGHRYLTLKDAEATISAVIWKSRPVPFEIEEGMKVVCRGRLSLYAPRGQYNLDVFQIRPVGIGALQLAYDQLFARLESEGLFEESRKRAIPRFPRTIGVVTSETGAALHDILTVLRRRYPVVKVILRPAGVQGLGSELEIAQAIREFNMLPATEQPDVLIVGRGGGSMEDLWCFNEEAVARAIYASKIPVISAVGHEVDVTIADHVADLRAPTPTAAAELATPDIEELLSVIAGSRRTLDRIMRSELQTRKREIAALGSANSLASIVEDVLERRHEEILRYQDRSFRTLGHSLERAKLTLARDAAKLQAMSPYSVLERGYAILETPDGNVLPRLNSVLESGEKVGILVMADGRITVRFD
jgi:exodeoxyribonuclease VII large subunit